MVPQFKRGQYQLLDIALFQSLKIIKLLQTFCFSCCLLITYILFQLFQKNINGNL